MICPHCHKEISSVPKAKFNFELIYQFYPKKMGKAQGIKKCEKEIKTEEDFKALDKAVKKFSEFHRLQGTEAPFIPYFSTFMSSWRDWLEEDTGKTQSSSIYRSETTAEYLERVEQEEDQEDDWAELDPERVRDIIAKAMGGKGMP